jgi:flagellar M-ring protein FliF
MSLAVLVDQAVRWEGQGSKIHRIIEQPAPEKLKSIRDLVAAATGFSADRGDQLIVESLPFESTLNLEPPSTIPAAPKSSGTTAVNLPPWLARALENRAVTIGAALGIGFILVMLRRVFAKMFSGKGKAKAGAPTALPSTEGQLEAQRQAQLDAESDLQAQLDAAALAEATKKSAVLVKRLREGVVKDATLPAHIVRGWLNEGN